MSENDLAQNALDATWNPSIGYAFLNAETEGLIAVSTKM